MCKFSKAFFKLSQIPKDQNWSKNIVIEVSGEVRYHTVATTCDNKILLGHMVVCSVVVWCSTIFTYQSVMWKNT